MRLNKNSIFAIIFITIILFTSLLLIGSLIAPYFTLYLLFLLLLVVFYTASERWILHDAAEFENRFWTLLSFLFANCMVLVTDSPFYLTIEKRGITTIIFIIVMFTYLAHNYNRHRHRIALTKRTMIIHDESIKSYNDKDNWFQSIINFPSNYLSIKLSNQTINKQTNEKSIYLPKEFYKIFDYMNIIDNKFLSSNLIVIFFLFWVLYCEKKIIIVFEEASSTDLNFALPYINLPLILYKIKDHRYARQPNRTKLLKLLCVTRIKDLTTKSKVILLDAIMRLRLSATKECENYVQNIILTTVRDSLSELKCMMDSKLDINNMHKLLYNDIRTESIYRTILNHIVKHAREQKAHSLIGTREGKRRHIYAWRKILSDVDDTLICSGGSYPAGVDTRYPSKALYPGVLAFYRELDLGPLGPDTWDSKKRLGNLVFLSARPHVYKDISEGPTFQKMLKLQETRGLHAPPALLAGSLDTGGKYMWEDNPEPLALKKYQNYREYMTLYPEYTSVFIGDNGQGDARVAEMVLQDPQFRDNLDRVYIHVVKPLGSTYISNTSILLPNQLIDKGNRMIKDKICFFETYIDAAIDAYEHNLIKLSGLRSIMSEAIADFKAIPLSDWMKSFNSTSVITSNDTMSWTYHRETRLREINTAIHRGNKILLSKGLSDVKPIRIDCQYPIGKPVVTKYGLGIVLAYRPSDGIYDVALQWDITGENKPNIGYFTSSALRHIHFTCMSPLISIAPSKRSVNQPNLKIYKNFPWTIIRYNVPNIIQPIKNEIKKPKLSFYNEIDNIYISKYMDRYSKKNEYLMNFRHKERLPISLMLWYIEGNNLIPFNCYIKRELNGPIKVPLSSSNNNTITSPKDDTINRQRTRSLSSGYVTLSNYNQKSNAMSVIIGSIGWTRYGHVYVIKYREKDDMLIVKYLKWIGFGYIKRCDVIQVTDANDTSLHQLELQLENEYNSIVQSLDNNITNNISSSNSVLTSGSSISISRGISWFYSPQVTSSKVDIITDTKDK